MKTFPMFLRVADRRIVIVGSGEQAAQKARLAMKTEAEIIVVAHDPNAELRGLAEHGRIRIIAEADVSTFRDTALVFVATGCKGADSGWHCIAKAAGALVNVVDAPDLCDAITPSIVDRDPVVVAIGTEGTAPVLGRMIKTRIEEMLEPGLGRLSALAGQMRGQVAHRVPRPERRTFWRWVFDGAPRRLHARGEEHAATRLIEDAIASGGVPDRDADTLITVIGNAEGPADLMTLRAVQRLQEADTIFVPHDADPSVLELARRDAERVTIGSDDLPGWPSNRILGRIRMMASEGGRIVWLMCGDAKSALRSTADCVDLEILPGVSPDPDPLKLSA